MKGAGLVRECVQDRQTEGVKEKNSQPASLRMEARGVPISLAVCSGVNSVQIRPMDIGRRFQRYLDSVVSLLVKVFVIRASS